MGLFLHNLGKTAPRHIAPKYTLEVSDWDSDSDDWGRFISLDLFSEGNNLDELIANAVFWLTDQDGGERGYREADSNDVEVFITQWFLEQQALDRK